MESSSDAENVEGQLGVIQGQMGQILEDILTEVKLGGWGRLQIWKMFQGQWGPILTKSRMEVKRDGWSRHPMPKMLKVS